MQLGKSFAPRWSKDNATIEKVGNDRFRFKQCPDNTEHIYSSSTLRNWLRFEHDPASSLFPCPGCNLAVKRKRGTYVEVIGTFNSEDEYNQGSIYIPVDCIENRPKRIEFGELLSTGNNAEVFSGTYDNVPVAIKFLIVPKNEINKTDVANEVKNASIMSELCLGVRVYDTFACDECIRIDYPCRIEFIVMEKFPMDVYRLLGIFEKREKKLTKEEFMDGLVVPIYDLFRRLYASGWYRSDDHIIHGRNVVVNWEERKYRLIDFDRYTKTSLASVHQQCTRTATSTYDVLSSCEMNPLLHNDVEENNKIFRSIFDTVPFLKGYEMIVLQITSRAQMARKLEFRGTDLNTYLVEFPEALLRSIRAKDDAQLNSMDVDDNWMLWYIGTGTGTGTEPKVGLPDSVKDNVALQNARVIWLTGRRKNNYLLNRKDPALINLINSWPTTISLDDEDLDSIPEK